MKPARKPAVPGTSALAALSALALAGCAMTTPPATTHQPMSARPVSTRVAVVNPGSIYQPGSASLVVFEDRRAAAVGDTLTVVISEKTSAAKKASADANHSGSTSLKVPTLSKVLGKNFAGADVEAASKSTFAGGGDAASNNTFTGNLGVTVIDVYPNGNLLVSGEKQVTINQGTEYIRFSGVVNPTTISSTNTVISTNVADARIEYRGTGYMDEAQTMGWASRALMSVWPF